MSKELKAKVTLDVKSATQKLDLLAKKINSLDKKFSKTATNTSKVSKQVEKAVSATNRAKAATDKWAKSTKKVESGVKKTSSAIDDAGRKLKGFLAAFTGVMALRVVIDTSDTITSAENRLNALPDGYQKNTQDSLDKMYAAAQRSRTGYADMIGNVSKSMTLAPDAFQGNIDNAIRFQEIMGKTYALGGASAAEQSSSMYQMIQALGSGVLQGDELRSVREGAPLAYQAIEKFAKGIYGAEENLKDLASEGKITSDIVVAAMMQMGDEIDGKFEDTAMTFGQAFQMIKNDATKAFEPVLQQMNALLNSDAGKAAIQGISNVLTNLANVAMVVMNVFTAFFNFMYENWSWLQYIVYSVGFAIVAVFAMIIAKWIILVANFIIGIISVNLAFFGWILAIGLVLSALAYMGVSFEMICGFIVGVVLWAVSVVANVFIGLLNGLRQVFYSLFVEPIAGLIEWIVNAFSGGFDNIGDAFLNLLGQMLSMLVGFAKPAAKLIDAIFGTDTNGIIEEAQSALKGMGKNENAVTYNLEAPQIKRFDNTDAFDYGYKVGSSGANWVTDKIGDIGNMLGGASLPNITSPEYDTGGSYDPSKALNGIKDDTGDIKDAVDLTTEDLEYLRKVADMEWKKEFTTANITVDMSNYNTINGDSDLDGIVTKLSDRLYEELGAVANGVYA